MKFIRLNTKSWSLELSSIIQDILNSSFNVDSTFHLMLTGGNTAKRLYEAFGSLLNVPNNRKLNLYLTDERNVKLDDVNSNANLIKSNLFPRGLPENIEFHFFDTSIDNPDCVLDEYEKIIPNKIDLLLLTASLDGHIASIFPGNPHAHNTLNKVVHIENGTKIMSRYTITDRVIKDAKNIFVLCIGSDKVQLPTISFQAKMSPVDFPVALVKNATWVTDFFYESSYEK